jgi:hypothetical protein
MVGNRRIDFWKNSEHEVSVGPTNLACRSFFLVSQMCVIAYKTYKKKFKIWRGPEVSVFKVRPKNRNRAYFNKIILCTLAHPYFSRQVGLLVRPMYSILYYMRVTTTPKKLFTHGFFSEIYLWKMIIFFFFLDLVGDYGLKQNSQADVDPWPIPNISNTKSV